MENRFKSKAARDLMAFTLALDPTMKECLRQLLRMGAYNIRPDSMYIRNKDGSYSQTVDPCAWNADLDAFGKKNSMGVTLLRSRDSEWFLNGC